MNDICDVTSEGELAEVIASASSPLNVQGGGTRTIGRMHVGQVLSTQGLSGIRIYEPGALTLVTQAGTTIAEIEAALDVENQRLAFEPMDHRVMLGTTGAPTIGGVFASNTSGPRRVQVGAARDHALGVRFVDGMGNIIQNGGRVMKNVTGYDLVKLMCGSWGTLGVLSEVSCKVLPKPETSTTVKVAIAHWGVIGRCLSKALGTPYGISGAAGIEEGGQVFALIRVEGFEQSVRYRATQLLDVLSEFGACEVDDNFCWLRVRDVVDLKHCAAVWCVKLRPSALAAVFGNLDAEQEFSSMVDWGGGLLWLGLTLQQDGTLADIHARIQAQVATLGGHATLVKGNLPLGGTPFAPLAPAIADISTRLRAKFDPRGILNPGRMS